MRILLLSVMAIFWLRAPANASGADGDQLGTVGGVSVVSGEYTAEATDVVVKGADPIALRRVYSTGTGWIVEPELNIKVSRGVEHVTFGQELFAFVALRSGAVARFYLSGVDAEGVLHFNLDPASIRGWCNTSTGRVSGQADIINQELCYVRSAGTAQLRRGDGTILIYERAESSLSPWLNKRLFVAHDSEQYRLVEKRLPSGNLLRYSYNTQGRPDLIELWVGDGVAAWLRFRWTATGCQIDTSQGESIHYVFDGRELTQVQRSGSSTSYVYGEAGRLVGESLNGKKVRSWCYDSGGRVQETSFLGEEAVFTYRQGETEVAWADGLRHRYSYGWDQRLRKLVVLDRGGQPLVDVQRYWGAGPNAGRLICSAIGDGQGRILAAATYAYDFRGNVTDEGIYGNLEGHEAGLVDIDGGGHIVQVPHGEELHRYFDYDGGPRNLLTKVSDERGGVVEYEYIDGTNLLARRLARNRDGRILQRTFRRYSAAGLCVEEYEDDGTSDALSSLEGASFRWRRAYEYSHRGQLTRAVYEQGIVSRWGERPLFRQAEARWCYDRQGRLVSREVLSADGEIVEHESLSYSLQGLPTLYCGADGKEVHLCWDDFGRCTEVFIPSQQRWINFRRDEAGNVVARTETRGAESRTEQFTYDAHSHLIAWEDFRANRTEYNYDGLGRLVAERGPPMLDACTGQTVCPTKVISYSDPLSTEVIATSAEGDVHIYGRNLRGNLSKHVYPDGTLELWKYDSEGSLHRYRSPQGLVSIFEYDGLGRPVLEEVGTISQYGRRDNLLRQQRFAWSGGQLTQIRSEDGLDIRYDAQGRLSELRRDQCGASRPPTQSYEYDSAGRLSSIGVPYGSNSQVRREIAAFDALGRVTEISISEDDSTSSIREHVYRRDAYGRIVGEQARGLRRHINIWDSEFNEWGDLVRVADGDGREYQCAHEYFYTNSASQTVPLTTICSPAGDWFEIEHDPKGRWVSRRHCDESGQVVSRVERVLDLDGNEVERRYSGKDSAPSYRIGYKRGPGGRIETVAEAVTHASPSDQSDAKERVLRNIVYDVRGRIAGISGVNSASAFSYSPQGLVTRIEGTDGVWHEYSYAAGMVCRIRSASGCDVRRQIQSGRMTREEITLASTKSCVEVSWDGLNRVKGIRLPGHGSIQYAYDADRCSAVRRYDEGGDEVWVHQYTDHDVLGRPVSELLIVDGAERVTTRNSQGARVSVATPAFSQVVTRSEPRGYPTEIEQDSIINGGTKHCAYDAVGRLSQWGEQVYQYDSLGQLVSLNGEPCIYGRCGRLITMAGAKIIYDADGATKEIHTPDGPTRFRTDGWGNVNSVVLADGSAVQYEYDGLGRRVERRHISSTGEEVVERYCYLGYILLAITDGDGELTALQIPGANGRGLTGEAVAFELQGRSFCPLYDLFGNVRVLLDGESGESIEHYEYSAYGVESILDARGCMVSRSTVENPWRYRGHKTDADTGLVEFPFRLYTPEFARFLTPDPLGIMDSPNCYVFARNNPVCFTDRYGLTAEPLLDSAAEAYFYGAVETHCYCERHRDCKRGGALGDTIASGQGPNQWGDPVSAATSICGAGDAFLQGMLAADFAMLGRLTPRPPGHEYLGRRLVVEVAPQVDVAMQDWDLLSPGERQQLIAHGLLHTGGYVASVAHTLAIGVSALVPGGQFAAGALATSKAGLHTTTQALLSGKPLKRPPVVNRAVRRSAAQLEHRAPEIPDIIEMIDEWLGPGSHGASNLRHERNAGSVQTGSDLLLRSADGRRQIRFDIDSHHGLGPHLNIEMMEPLDRFPGDRDWSLLENVHVFPLPSE